MTLFLDFLILIQLQFDFFYPIVLSEVSYLIPPRVNIISPGANSIQASKIQIKKLASEWLGQGAMPNKLRKASRSGQIFDSVGCGFPEMESLPFVSIFL